MKPRKKARRWAKSTSMKQKFVCRRLWSSLVGAREKRPSSSGRVDVQFAKIDNYCAVKHALESVTSTDAQNLLDRQPPARF